MIQAPSTDSVELPNQIRLSYVEQGDADGVPVVLLHGLPLTWRSFEPVLPHLPSQLRVLAPNQRGHGDASRPEAGYGFGDFADDLAAFLDRLGIEAAVIVGHSMGSMVAQRFAIDHPRRTMGTVLVGSALSGRDDPAEWSAEERELWSAIFQLSDPVDPAFVGEYTCAFMDEGEPGSESRARFDSTVQAGLTVPARAYQEVWRSIVDDDLSAELAELETPAFVIWGDRDPQIPRGEQDALIAKLPNARLEVYAGAGHNPFWDQPERFGSDLTAFVQEVAADERAR